MRMFKFTMPFVSLHVLVEDHVEVVVESFVNLDDLVSHPDLIKFNY